MSQGGYGPNNAASLQGMNNHEQQQRMISNWNPGSSMPSYCGEPPYPLTEAVYNHPSIGYINPQLVPQTSNPNLKVPVGRLNITTCTKCKHINYYAEIELNKMDNLVEQLNSENENLRVKVKELEEKLREKLTPAVLASRDSDTVNSVIIASTLSATAMEFSPKSVPVVSAKGIDLEENTQLSPPMRAKKDNNVAGISSGVVHKKEKNTNEKMSCDSRGKNYKNYGPDKKIKTESQTHQDNSTPENWDEDCEEQPIIKNKTKVHPNQNNSPGAQNNSDQLEPRSQKPRKHDKSGNRDHQGRKSNSSKPKEFHQNHHQSKKTSEEVPSTSAESTGGDSKRERDTENNKLKRYHDNYGSRKSSQAEGMNKRSSDYGKDKHNDNYGSRKSSQAEGINKRSSDSGKDKHNKDQDSKDGVSLKDKKPKNIIEEIKDDLFNAPPEYSLAHCVAEDFRMGSGIAVRFKQEFRRTGELLAQNEGVGGCAYLEDKKHNRYIFYLVTKHLSNLKPTYNSFQRSLEALREKCLKLNVTKLAIPHIGCGLDRLEWVKVKGIINELFSDSNIEIRAYEFNVDGLPEAEGSRPKSPSVYVVYKVMELKNIQPFTTLLFFGTEDGYVDVSAKSLNEKFNFLSEYKSATKTVGSVWCYKKLEDYYVFSLIVQKRFAKNDISFVNLDVCCRELMKLCSKDKTEYVGLECLAHWSDDVLFTEKVVTMLRHSLHKPVRELWVCFGHEKEDINRNTMKLTYPYS